MSEEITLVERHVINPNHKYFKECDELAFKSKNLYNTTLYCVRQTFFYEKRFLNFFELNKKFVQRDKPEYRALPAKISKQVMRLVDQNFRSFFGLLRAKKNDSYKLRVSIPNYLDAEKGRQVVHYVKDAISFKKKFGYVHLSQTNIFIKSQIESCKIQFARIFPRGNHYIIEIGYKESTAKKVKNDHRYVSIDLGLNNLITTASNVINPIIINGRPIKSINRYYNKLISIEKKKLPKEVYTSKYIQNLYKRRYFKIQDYLHKSTSYIMNHLVSNQIDTLIVGYNSGWKQDINLGKKNNQNFVNIPFYRLVEMLKYKCKHLGINFFLQEESYTSKCSFLDNESVEKHEVYKGKRKQRGLFESSFGKKINADVNGALNILKKCLISKGVWNDRMLSDCIGVCRTPVIHNISY